MKFRIFRVISLLKHIFSIPLIKYEYRWLLMLEREKNEEKYAYWWVPKWERSDCLSNSSYLCLFCASEGKKQQKKHFRPEKIVEKLTKSKDCIVVPKVIHPFNVMFIKLVLPLRFLLSVLFTVIIYYWHARRKKTHTHQTWRNHCRLCW